MNHKNKHLKSIIAAGATLAIGGTAMAKRCGRKKGKVAQMRKSLRKKLRRKKGLRAKLRRLREDYGIYENEYGELFIENSALEAVMDEYDLYEEDAIDLIMESYEIEEEEMINEAMEFELYSEGLDDYDPRKMKDTFGQVRKDVQGYRDLKKLGVTPSDQAKQNYKNNAIAAAKSAALPAGALAAGAGALAVRKAMKKRAARKRRGFLGRLREDYGIYENEYGELFIENEMIDYVMEEYDLYEEDAIDLIMESYEEELEELEENAAREVVDASHHQVSVDAYRQYKQAEEDEGDADRNLARGGKHILGGIKRAPRSEQDRAGEGAVRFKNREDDGDMDGKFIDSGIKRPMGAGRKIAEDSDMGF